MHRSDINTLVAIPQIGRASQAPDPAYHAENFIYNKETDTYTCPEGQLLHSNQTRYKARNYSFKQYKTKACKNCPARGLCTTSRANGKIVQRTEYAAHLEAHRRRVAAQPELYIKRQALVEPPFGTIKRQWGFDHILTKKGQQSASADAGLMILAYNLKRLFNILGKELHAALKNLFALLACSESLLIAPLEAIALKPGIITLCKSLPYQNTNA